MTEFESSRDDYLDGLYPYGEPPPWPLVSERHARRGLSAGAAVSLFLAVTLVGLWLIGRVMAWVAGMIA